MCSASKQEKAAAANAATLSNTMTQQAQQVFGDSNAVFNTMNNSYQSVVNAGPSQEGYSAAQMSALNSAVITNNAQQYKNVSGAARIAQSGQVGAGGAGAVNSGATESQNLGIAEAAAQSTAAGLNQNVQNDWAQGNQNYWNAAKGETTLPGVFDPATQAGTAATGSTTANFEDAQQMDTQNHQWVSSVVGLAGGVIGANPKNIFG
jgi:hypothetical protein